MNVKIDTALLDSLTEQAKASPRLRMNLDLRTSDADTSQRMLNAIEPGSVVPVHRHQKTSETFVVLRGRVVEEFYDELVSFKPDLFITVAYGKILTESVLSIPAMGCINVHASLLPKYRGAAPLWHAVINGEKESGITTMMTDVGMDTGDILIADKCEISENMTMGELHDKLSEMGANTLQKTLEQLEAGTLTRTPQNHDEATYSPMVSRETGKIDWTRSSLEIHNLVRGTNPFPVSYSFDEEGERIKIWSTLLTDIKKPSSKEAGDVIEASAEGIYVATGDGVIKITELQGPSGKRMKAGDYVNGHKITKLT